MKKELKEMLKRAKIQVKWRNCRTCGIWQNEDLQNLLDFVNRYKIKIRKVKIKNNNYDNFYKIKMSLGGLEIQDITTHNDLERKLYNFINYSYVYLGDETQIKTRFDTKTWFGTKLI